MQKSFDNILKEGGQGSNKDFEITNEVIVHFKVTFSVLAPFRQASLIPPHLCTQGRTCTSSSAFRSYD